MTQNREVGHFKVDILKNLLIYFTKISQSGPDHY